MKDVDGFSAFVAAGAAQHLRAAYLLTGGNEADAHDLLQASLVKMCAAWDRVDADGRPDAYLRRIMVNTSTSWWRRWRRHEVVTTELPERGHDPFPSLDERSRLVQALARLTPGERAVIVLRHLDDLSETRTAELLGCSVGTVKSQSSRALAKLRKHLDLPSEEATIS